MDFTQHLSKLVLNYEKSKKLKELGCTKPAQFCWGKIQSGGSYKTELLSRTVFDGLVAKESVAVQLGDEECFAYTAEELSDMLPKKITCNGQRFGFVLEKKEWHGHEDAFIAYYINFKGDALFSTQGHTLADCLANLLIHHKEFIRSLKVA